MSKYTSVLFDLDGNLLPMELDKFVETYFTALANYMLPYGYDPKALTDAVWAGTRAMVKNDGTMLNKERFWQAFSYCLGADSLKHMDAINAFYTSDFAKAKISTWDNPNAKRAVKAARQAADKVILATNPLFPPCAVEMRLSWIGLTPEDFDYITTYDNSHYCKPNPKYFTEIAEKLNLSPDKALMIGNDLGEDTPAKSVGFDLFITTDCLLGDKSRLSEFTSGSFEQLCQYLENL